MVTNHRVEKIVKRKINDIELTERIALKEQFMHAPPDADFEQEVVAISYGCSTSLLQKWRSHGGGPCFKKIGRTILYTKADVLIFFSQKYTSTAQYAQPAKLQKTS
jgi:hypothetical protein